MSLTHIYLFVGPSGSGKTTITKELEKLYGYIPISSYTTRPPRYEGEEGHIFVTEEEFDALDEMAAFTKYNGYRYGVTSEIIDKSDLYVIDPAGVQYFNEHYHGNKKPIIIFINADPSTRLQRMKDRGDSDEAAYERLRNDLHEFTKSLNPDICVTNDVFQRTVGIIHAIIEYYETWDI